MGELPEATRDLVAMASSNSDRLVRLISDVLDIEKIDAEEMSFKRAHEDLARARGPGRTAERRVARKRSDDRQPGRGADHRGCFRRRHGACG
jgi:signal transduction histidine kinase